MRTFKKRWIIGFLTLAAVTVLLGSLLTPLVKRALWMKDHRRIQALIHQLYLPIPNECTENGWPMAVSRTDIAFENIAYDPTYISRSELALLRIDLEKIIAENRASPELLFKIYDRIGISNKTTEGKSEKWREDFTEQVERSYKPKPFKLPPE
jgi:hypothetical protein